MVQLARARPGPAGGARLDRCLKFACASGPGTVAPLTVTASSKLEARTPCLRIGRSPAPVLAAAGSLSEHSRPECQCSEGNCPARSSRSLSKDRRPTARARRSLRLAVGLRALCALPIESALASWCWPTQWDSAMARAPWLSDVKFALLHRQLRLADSELTWQIFKLKSRWDRR
jgi:hypothetical protein